MMRVLIDLRWMQPGLTGGIEAMSRAYLRQLIALDGANRYDVLLPHEARFDFDTRERSNFHLYAADAPGYFLDRWLRLREAKRGGRPFPLYSSSLVERLKAQVDVVLCFNGAIAPDLRGLPAVVLGVDLQHEYFSEFFAAGELAGRRQAIEAVLQYAGAICAISAFTRQTFLEKLGAAPQRISVVHLAADERFMHPPAAQQVEAILKNYNLQRGTYLFYPAATWHHKNHAVLFKALALLRTEGITPSLVCSGAAKEAQAELAALVETLRLGEQVQFLGYLPEEHLPALYSGAQGLVFPSLFEGFGMPVLEAMACGCPVACSRAASLPEVAGDAALYFDPENAQAIAAALRRLISEPALRAELVKRGAEQVRRFSWQASTRQLVGALGQVCLQKGVQAAHLAAQPFQPGVELRKRWRHARKRVFSLDFWRAGWNFLRYRVHPQSSARRLLARANAAVVHQQPVRVVLFRAAAALIAPQVFFALVVFPPLRRRFLRGKLKPV